MERQTRIAIVGAGLAGLTLAGLLQRAGFTVALYEQAAAFARIGAGIILSPNVSKVLRRLDIEDELATTGIRPDAFVSRAWDTGRTLYELRFDPAAEAHFDGYFINIHRADLHDVLQKPLAPGTIQFGHQLAGLEPRGEAIRLRFANGATAEADIVIGADGIRSRVRDAILGKEEPRFTGRIAPRAVFPTERIPGPMIRDCTKWWGPDRHVLTYFMTPRRDEVYVMGAVPAERWDGGDSFVPGSREDFIEAFAHFHADLRRVMEAATDVTVWPIHDRPRNDRWSEGAIGLMGDACHAVRPFMAAGGAMAIEDAMILSRCLARFETAEEAFATYAALRIPRVAEVQRISIENSWMHGPTEVDWFFGYDPSIVELIPAAASAPLKTAGAASARPATA
ncbi:FAD-dependent monooxygenase [Propylenella binzhouense]|nr:FAD-dependent monooxygenase [Propylenella binzhouense]